MDSLLAPQLRLLPECATLRITGRVSRVIGLVIECRGLRIPIGSLCRILGQHSEQRLVAEVVGFRDHTALLMPLGDTHGIAQGDPVEVVRLLQEIPVSDQLLGRIVNAMGEPIDGKGPIYNPQYVPLHGQVPNPLLRRRIQEPLQTGIRCIDGLMTIGKGQRMGLFAGSGVGKSVLMGMVARNTNATVNVIALVGERGREVREFLEKDLGPEGLARSVVVIATSNEPNLVRVKAAHTASAIAEHFRDQGKDVLLLVDSVTRIAMSQREIGLSIGEPPATKGYPPSVFAMMPKLLERAGCSDKGSITGVYTVLVEADDENEPVADTVRSILDGHVWLNRRLATRGHYPAIEVGQSISRVMVDVVDERHLRAARQVGAMMAAYREAEDLINIGAYAKGSNPAIDRAIAKIDAVWQFLRQDMKDATGLSETREWLLRIAESDDVAGAGAKGKTAAGRRTQI